MYKLDLSVIISVTKSLRSDNIDELHDKYINALVDTGKSFEIIYVTDSYSLEIFDQLKIISDNSDNIKIVKLAKKDLHFVIFFISFADFGRVTARGISLYWDASVEYKTRWTLSTNTSPSNWDFRILKSGCIMIISVVVLIFKQTI